MVDEQRAQAIFMAVIESTATERASYLDTECAGDAAMRHRIEELLLVHETPVSGSPLVADADITVGRPHATTQQGLAADPDATVAQSTMPFGGDQVPGGTVLRYFGDYEIERELGRGGMGVVYRARQISLNRPVAIKMLKAGVLADEEELRRFRNEAESAALLDHGGLVPVYEVGEQDGQRYFSMKLIEGKNLAEQLDRFKVNPREAARLVALIADAVAHAHARGILHRDLKPANVLLDAEGRPYVTDFGLAKRIEADGAATQSGAVLGTPQYMSPEQAEGRRGGVTTATDVYGLGAVLYALLTGKAPFGGSVLQTLEAVRTQPPQRPSKANHLVPLDLETICLKCLEKDPRHRYATAQAVADDLTAWLENRPIAARRCGTLERSRLWCKRRPAVAALSAATLVALLTGSTGIVINWMEVRRQRDLLARANQRITNEWHSSQNVNNLLVNGLLANATPLGRETTVVELLDRISGSIEASYVGKPKLEAAMRRVIGDSYRAQGKLDRAELHLARCASLVEALPPDDELDRLACQHSIAALRLDQAHAEEACELARSAVDGRRRILGQADPATIDSVNLLTLALKALGKSRDARALLLPYWSDAVKTLGPHDRMSILTASNLAALSLDLDELDDAEARLRELIELKQAMLRADHPEVFLEQNNLGALLLRRHKPKDAVSVLRPAYRTAVELVGNDHAFSRAVRNNLAAALLQIGETAQADQLLGELPADDSVTSDEDAVLTNNRASMLWRQRNYQEAEALMRAVLAWRKRSHQYDEKTAQAMVNLCLVLAEKKDFAEAEDLAADALGIYERLLKPADLRVVDCRATLGWMMLEDGKAAQAEPLLKDALEHRSADPSCDAWKVASSRSLLGAALAARGEPKTAEPMLVDGYKTLASLKNAPTQRVEAARERLIKLYENWPGHESEAKALR